MIDKSFDARGQVKEILLNQLQMLQEESKKVAKTEDHFEIPRSLNLISEAMVNTASAIVMISDKEGTPC